MGLLNVTPDTLDPMFVDNFDVLRRAETIDTHGRSVKTPVTYPRVFGTVVPITPNNLDRNDGYQVQGRSIKVVTKFRLQGEVTGSQPDVVIWEASHFVVKHVDYFHSFGGGHVEAECLSMDHTDAAIVVPSPGAMLFNRAEDNALPILIGAMTC